MISFGLFGSKISYLYRSLMLCPACLVVLSLATKKSAGKYGGASSQQRLVNFQASAAICLSADLLWIFT
jgi:hypothetical protein